MSRGWAALAGLSILHARDGNSSSGGSGILAVFPLEDFGVPAYLQLAAIIRGRIAAGEWSHGPLPSNRAFQGTYGVGEYVVTRAIRLLEEEEGVVFTVPRRGVYIRQQS
jgi:hypothetical protein